jgi:hypothetical protein
MGIECRYYGIDDYERLSGIKPTKPGILGIS